MRTSLSIVWLAALGLAVGLAVASLGWAQGRPRTKEARAPTANSPLPPRVYSRNTAFSIPFRIDIAAGGKGPREVQLHVSEDAGKSWRTAATARPEETSFLFRAPRDGEYWFLVRTIDPQGKHLPAGPPRVELRVVVDTTMPTLEMTAQRGPDGEVEVHWRASDANLAADSLRGEYQLRPAGERWTPLAPNPLQPHPSGKDYHGSATWWPGPADTPLAIRSEIRDAAGNRAVSEVSVDGAASAAVGHQPEAQARGLAGTAEAGAPRLGSAGSVTTQPTFPEQRQPIAPPIAGPWPGQEADDPFSARRRNRTSDSPQMDDRYPGPEGPSLQERGPEPAPERMGDIRSQRPAQRHETGESFPGTSSDRTSRDGPAFDGGAAGPSLEAGEIIPPPSGPAEQIPPPIDAPPAPQFGGDPGGLDEEAAAFQGELLPPGVRPQMVNTTRFELEYDVAEVGPSGIGSVELWLTRDGGRNWQNYGEDADQRSPIVVEVEGEGIYGFRIVVESGAGLRGTPPQSGSSPEIWIGVDRTRPVARLTTAEQGTGDRAGELVIRWEADDMLLADRPIALSFSDGPDGPWTTIASGLENTGRYAWRLDRRVPDMIYLRLEARDEAGNIQISDTAEPLPLDRARPQGRIRGVRPANQSAAGPVRYYNLR